MLVVVPVAFVAPDVGDFDMDPGVEAIKPGYCDFAEPRRTPECCRYACECCGVLGVVFVEGVANIC